MGLGGFMSEYLLDDWLFKLKESFYKEFFSHQEQNTNKEYILNKEAVKDSLLKLIFSSFFY